MRCHEWIYFAQNLTNHIAEGMSRMVIDDEMWSRLEKLLPKPKGRHGKDDRLFMEAICWMLRTGAAWRDLPGDYGKWKSVYNRYNN